MKGTDSDLGRAPAELSLLTLGIIAARRRHLIIAVFLLIVAGVSIGVYATPPKYQGTTKFLVRKARAEMVVTSERSSTLSSADVSEAEMNSEIELLNARDVLEEVAARTILSAEHKPITEARREQAVRELQRNLGVGAVRKTNIILVAYTANQPDLALNVLRQVSALFLEKHLSTHRTVGAHAFFRAQADYYKDELRRVQTQFSDFRLQRNAVSIDSEKELLIRRRSDLQAQASEVNAAVDQTSASITGLQEATTAMGLTVLSQTRSIPNQSSSERLTTLVTEMKNRRTQLLAKFQPDDRAVLEIEQEIADTAAVLAQVQAAPTLEHTMTLSPVRESLLGDLSRAQVQLGGLMARRARLAKEEAGLWTRTSSLEAATPEHDALDKELKAAEASYQLYETKSEEARIAEALDQEKITNISIAQAPTVPRLPSGPSHALLLAVGVCLAGFISVGTALGVEYISPDEGAATDDRRGADAGADLGAERQTAGATYTGGASIVPAPVYSGGLVAGHWRTEADAVAPVQNHGDDQPFKVGRVYDALQAFKAVQAGRSQKSEDRSADDLDEAMPRHEHRGGQ